MNLSRKARFWCWVVLLLLVAAASGWSVRTYLLSRALGLPQRFSFDSGSLDDWKAFGGTWEVSDGAMHNASDERGAKLVAGSNSWTDYLMEADVQLSGSQGNAGLIVRVSDEDEGVDSYRGYYAGLSAQPYELANTDNVLLLGKADHAYAQLRQASVPDSVVPFHWYHLKVLVLGCQIVASVTSKENPGQAASVSVTDPQCIRAGKVGLRSYATGASWRNVSVRSATPADLKRMLASSTSRSVSVGEKTSAQAQQITANAETRANAIVANTRPVDPGVEENAGAVQPIRDLLLTAAGRSSMGTVRGIVIATRPALYIEDSSGGAKVRVDQNLSLNLGDEIQATGTLDLSGTVPELHATKVELLWVGAPLAPTAVTAQRAAIGSVLPSLVELKGYLRGKERGAADGSLILDLSDVDQTFQALMTGERASQLFDKLKVGSLLTIEGVCTSDSEYTHNLVPFVLLLRSTDDIEVIARPPWWNARHVSIVAIAITLLLLAAQFLYARIEHWRMRAVVEERERLAHEMHDTLAQSFAGIGFQLQAVQSELKMADEKLRQHVDLACRLVRQSHEESRRCIATLRPESLDRLGVAGALERCATRLVEGGTIQVHITTQGAPQTIPLLISDTLFRIGQEAIANAVRHAQATSIEIAITYRLEAVEISVVDNGIGFVAESDHSCFGLRGMRERARLVAADFRIESHAGQGTRILVVAQLPLPFSLANLPYHVWTYFKEHRPHG